MPSWPPRVLSGSSPTTDHMPAIFSSSNQSFHNDDEHELQRFVEASLNLSVTASSSSSECFHPERHPRHGRSSSPHFLPSLADDRRKWTDEATIKTRGGILNGCESPQLTANTLSASIRTTPTQQGNAELVTGKCATCGSLVRWPRHLNVFRCTVCLMVNHLKSTSAEPTNEDGLRAELQVNIDETEMWNQKLGMQMPEISFFRF